MVQKKVIWHLKRASPLRPHALPDPQRAIGNQSTFDTFNFLWRIKTHFEVPLDGTGICKSSAANSIFQGNDQCSKPGLKRVNHRSLLTWPPPPLLEGARRRRNIFGVFFRLRCPPLVRAILRTRGGTQAYGLIIDHALTFNGKAQGYFFWALTN